MRTAGTGWRLAPARRRAPVARRPAAPDGGGPPGAVRRAAPIVTGPLVAWAAPCNDRYRSGRDPALDRDGGGWPERRPRDPRGPAEPPERPTADG
ncbi:hypothetical protein GCM10010123_05900 [Pilimelia anulata]|uniref:Uncharacterized protein n=1 Tax=Pilimelia anulata TaxID=53371 RepID=A0A8J3F8J1_9ACTN|nr:hypothetical protein [Pilimelia anulata]GGJ78783.1 hypothetical protein GCM10010123_05900 [Pilimelia anulata]